MIPADDPTPPPSNQYPRTPTTDLGDVDDCTYERPTEEQRDPPIPDTQQATRTTEVEEEIEVENGSSITRSSNHAPWFAYVAPVVIFSSMSWLESRYPNHYVAIYIAKALATTIALIAFRSAARDYNIGPRKAFGGVLVGLAVFAEWVVIERYVPYRHAGSRVGFNPFVALPDPGERALFLITRFYGLVLMVPFMEELFWRSFLLRYLTDSEWRALRPGQYSWGALAFVAAGFAAAHPEWLPAFICGVAYALLLRYTRSLTACFIAHAVTNMSLGIYVVATGAWVLW